MHVDHAEGIVSVFSGNGDRICVAYQTYVQNLFIPIGLKDG